jgi:ribosome-binding protein aMBF1 (putative translation factor)
VEEDDLTLEQHLDLLREQRHARKGVILDRARSALANAREDLAKGIEIDPVVIRDLERSIAEYERYTIERPGLPQDP